MASFSLSERFPPSTGTRYMVDLHRTLTHALQTRDSAANLQPESMESAANDNLAMARATQRVLDSSIRRSSYCVNAIIERARHPDEQTDIPSLVNLMAGTPESMRANGLYLLISLQAPIPQARFMEMARRYFQNPQPDMVPPDSEAHSALLYSATKGMQSIRKFHQMLEKTQSEPVFAAALKESQGWPDPRAYFAQHQDPRIPLVVTEIQKDVPDLLAAIYAVNHYLATAENGATQAQGYQGLEVSLHGIQRAGGSIPLTDREASPTIGDAMQSIRNSLPVELTVPERLRAIFSRIQEQDQASARKAAMQPPVETPSPPQTDGAPNTRKPRRH